MFVGRQVKERPWRSLEPEKGQFAITAKEKTTHQAGRLFTYSTMLAWTYYSTLERNIKDSIFSDASQQTMTLSEVQLHKRLMTHRGTKKSQRREWKVVVSLDFKECWHFCLPNAAPTLELIDEFFGFDAPDLHLVSKRGPRKS